MNSIGLIALREAERTRVNLKLGITDSVNVIDVAISLGCDVQIIDMNMEGMYLKGTPYSRSKIFLSNKRPLPRRSFTCAHELGHHIFGHGSKIDPLEQANKYTTEQKQEETIVNQFAAAFLMPVLGLHAEFNKRGWRPNLAHPVEFYTLCSLFGVGYQTILNHCRYNNLLNSTNYERLSKITPKRIFREQVSYDLDNTHFKIIDGMSSMAPIELEESNYLVIPNKTEVKDNFLKLVGTCPLGSIYQAEKAGRTNIRFSEFKIEINIQRKDFYGHAEYRNLEDE